ncbi:hypothetical protein Back11_41970 [Paenibacillus baekrokdamisoli]|uniref:Uncharacterized protein n=1 Tax=Paenibacillus baekrokdamisoli TaxID=1712516 RepID=A0A3G9IX14_9BACL|nr:hypothetical protein [Paenibacillus baekrokdamisoli]MBB3068104.1 hypothetical protein [Paenibacillus baekrokdamisoli]BBH22852.1 hypothetical protein Back11_41970 [Paenibacillus baekrokdamisoli]
MGEKRIIDRAKLFIYEHARLLDRKRYEYHFEGGSKGAVIEALRAYQNSDGGFGNGLEPDLRGPHSHPIPTEMALSLMEELNSYDVQILEGINSYLREHTLSEGGVPFSLRSVNDYPHAPWWTAEEDSQPSINPTGRMLGLLYKQQTRPEIVQEEYFIRSVAYVWRYMEQERPVGYHDGIHALAFLQLTPERERASQYQPIMDQWLSRPDTMERNPRAEGYVHKLLDWAPLPESYARKFITDEELEEHLQVLITQQQEDGGWAIAWPPVSPAGEQEWRGLITVERLLTLKAYGRL